MPLTFPRWVPCGQRAGPTNAADAARGPELAPPPGTTGIADRNSWSPDLTAELARSRRQGGPSRKVETANAQLADHYRAIGCGRGTCATRAPLGRQPHSGRLVEYRRRATTPALRRSLGGVNLHNELNLTS